MDNLCFNCKRVLGVHENKYYRTSLYGVRQILCEKCFKESVGEYFFERQCLAKLGCSIPICGFIAIIIGYVLLGWKIALSIFVGTTLLTILVFTALSYFIKKKDRKEGIDVKNIKWCKTCKYFRKIKDWTFQYSNSQAMLDEIKIPCRIFGKTKEVWIEFFDVPSSEKYLYPKNCTLWSKK